MEVIYALTMSPLFLMKVMDAKSSSKLPTFDSAVYFSSLTLLSLVNLSVFSNSESIKVGNIYSSISTPESYHASNCAAKIQSASQIRSSNLHQKCHISRTSYHARTDWLLYQINLVTCVPVYLNWYRAYLTTIQQPLKDDRYFNSITSTFCC